MTIDEYSEQIKTARELRNLNRAQIEADSTRWYWKPFRRLRERLNMRFYHKRVELLWTEYARTNPNEAAANGGRVPPAATLPLDVPIPQTFVRVDARGLAQFVDVAERPEPGNTLAPHQVIDHGWQPVVIDKPRLNHAEKFIEEWKEKREQKQITDN